jgi:hypothetical protein
MSPFPDGMFNLGYGSPDPENELPDPQPVIDLISKVEGKVIDSIIDGLKDLGTTLNKLDNKVTGDISERMSNANDIVEGVSRKIRNDVSNKIELASVAQSPLNAMAKRDGFDLTTEASKLMKTPNRERVTDELRNAAKQYQRETALPTGSPELEAAQPSALNGLVDAVKSIILDMQPKQKLKRVGFKQDFLTEFGSGPLVQEGIVPTKVERWEELENGDIAVWHKDANNGVTLASIVPKPVEEGEGKNDPGKGVPLIDPVGGGKGDKIEIEGEMELPIGDFPQSPPPDAPDTWPGGDIPGEIPNQGCPGCQCAPCICINQPGETIRPPTWPPEPEYPGERTPPVVNIENIIQLPEEEEEEEEEEEPKYTAFCDYYSGRVYVIQAGKPNPNPRARPIGFGDSPDEAIANGKGLCQSGYPTIALSETNLFAKDARLFCGVDSYDVPNLVPGQIDANVLDSLFVKGTLRLDGAKLDAYIADLNYQVVAGRRSTWEVYIITVALGAAKLLDKQFPNFIAMFGSDIPGFMLTMGGRVIISFFEQWFSGDLGYIKQPLVYSSQEKVPLKYPNEIQAMQAFISGQIKPETWATWTRMNGYCVEPMAKLLDYHRTKFTPGQLLDMVRRGLITYPEYRAEFRHWGYVGDGDAELFDDSNKFLPPIQDLVRFMVRDVFDTENRDVYAPNTGFNAKWRRMDPKYGAMQGISDDVAELYWRAHWLIPPTGQLYNIYHRNRVRTPPGGKKFTYPMLEKALEINDNNPEFIPYLIQQSEHLLTRVDVRRAYRLGAIEVTDVVDNYKMRGYSDKDAETLGEYAERDKEQFLLARKETKLLRDGSIGIQDWRVAMGKYNPTVPQLQYVESITLAERRKPLIKKCVRNIEKQFSQREINLQQAEVLFQQLGFSPDNVELHMAGLNCLRQTESKSLTAGKLCELYSQELITQQMLRERLVDLGYEEVDALLLVWNCSLKKEEKAQKELERDLKKLKAAEEKAAKDQQKRADKKRKQGEQMERMRERRKLAEDRRELRQLKATQKLQRCLSVEMEIATSLVKEALLGFETIYNFTSEERTTLLERSVDKCKEMTPEGFNNTWVRIAESFSRLQPDSVDDISSAEGS